MPILKPRPPKKEGVKDEEKDSKKKTAKTTKKPAGADS